MRGATREEVILAILVGMRQTAFRPPCLAHPNAVVDVAVLLEAVVQVLLNEECAIFEWSDADP